MQQAYEVEARSEYERALKLGRRELSHRGARGERGLLPVLDQITEQNKIMAYVKRPEAEIELNKVVGTYTEGRSHSFSASFLPINSEASEFASKWINLCAEHMINGLRDPIEVYEYLWNYYVVEGNKRVSILKYFGALTVRAKITRLIPQLDEDEPETALYYSFLKYEKNGLFKNLRMSTAEKYEEMALLEDGLKNDGKLSEDINFDAMLIQFSNAYKDLKIAKPVGDALLEYVKIYSLPKDVVLSELKQRLEILKPQLAISDSKKEPVLVLDKTDEAPQSLISRLFSTKRTARVLFVYEKGREDYNWIGAHEFGRQVMQKRLEDSVESYFIDGLDEENAEEKLEPYKNKVDLVFFSSKAHSVPALRFQLENPNVVTMLYSRVREHNRILTYYGRYYETAFLCGMAAGYSTKSDIVAYITPHTEKRYTADINAFALGVKYIRPNARVLLVQKGVKPGDRESTRNGLNIAASMGADTAFCQLYWGMGDIGLPKNVFSAVIEIDGFGNPKKYIAAPEWNWGRFYTEIVKAYLNGSLELFSEIDMTERSVAGFWWGMATGVLKFAQNDVFSPYAENMLHFLRSSISRNSFFPFRGPVRDKDGAMQIEELSSPKAYDILNMDWIADFVEVIDDED